MKKKVLITGSNGFVGQSLISFLEGDYEVYGFDRSLSRNLKPENSFIGDLGDFELVRGIFEKVLPDIVIHLAAIVHKNNADTTEKNYNFINYECSAFLFDQCKKNNSKVIFASTIEVYGEVNQPIINADTKCNPLSYYAKSKYNAEKYLTDINNLEYAILRFTPLYGKDFTLNLDKRIYLINKKIAYYFKDGDYTFDFCSINNVCDTVEYICSKKVKNGIYVLADKKSISVREIINLKKKYEGLKIVVKLPYRICSILINIMGYLLGKISKKDVYLSKRNFDKLFSSKQYQPTKLEGFEIGWNLENTLFGD